MDIKKMQCFLALAEEKHFGRAAARLNIVQPALSMQIKALEEDLGGPLFLRSSRHVELTEAGILFQAEAGRILEQLDHAELNVRRAMRGEIGRVRIGFVGNAAFSGKLGEDMRNFHQQYPEAEITLQELLPEAQLEQILSGQLDIGYCAYVDRQPDPRLSLLPLGEWDGVLIMPDNHRLARKKAISNQDLQAETIVVYAKQRSNAQLLTFFQEKIGYAPAGFRIANSTLSLISLVVAGFGVAVGPLSMRALGIPGLTMRPLDKNSKKIAMFLAHRSQEPGSAVRAYIKLVQAGRSG